MKPRHLIRLSCALLCSVPLLAENYAPKTMVFTGAAAYNEKDLVAVTGLTPGKPVSTAEIETAMQHLVDTGLFSDMRYTVDGKALTFALTPVAADQLLSARYSNFVWWKQDELTPLVHARIPLFTGGVPVTGTMKNQIEAVLAALVLEKGVKASISSIASGGGAGEAVSAEVFSIAQPMVEIGEVHINGVSANAASRVEEIKKRYVGQEFDVNSIGPALTSNLKDAYLDLGYLDAAVDPTATGVPQVSAMAITVDLSTAAREGTVYKVSQITWPESTIVSKGGFAEAAQLKRGDPASRIELLSTRARAAGKFESAGYLDAKVSVKEQKDEAHHEIAYTFEVTPGEQYKVASVKTPGLSAEQQAEFDKAWKLAPGQVYNGEVLKASLGKILSTRPFQGYAPKVGRMNNSGAHLVTLTVSFVRSPARS